MKYCLITRDSRVAMLSIGCFVLRVMSSLIALFDYCSKKVIYEFLCLYIANNIYMIKIYKIRILEYFKSHLSIF